MNCPLLTRQFGRGKQSQGYGGDDSTKAILLTFLEVNQLLPSSTQIRESSASEHNRSPQAVEARITRATAQTNSNNHFKRHRLRYNQPTNDRSTQQLSPENVLLLINKISHSSWDLVPRNPAYRPSPQPPEPDGSK